MQLNTRHFGLIEINEEDIIDFPEGLPGFEDVKKFIIINSYDENSPFQWLQSIDNPELAFVIIDPRLIKNEYIVDVDTAEVEILNITDVNKVLIYSIIVVPEDITKMTANLKAPVIINTENNKGKQVVMENNEYTLRYCFLEGLRRSFSNDSEKSNESQSSCCSEKSDSMIGG
ncbi:MAG: flagellar assembly protein FliW [Clostridia bacterium]